MGGQGNETGLNFRVNFLASLAVFSFFGLPANLLSIWLILRAKQKKSTTTCLLLNLAIADVVNLLLALLVIVTVMATDVGRCRRKLMVSTTMAPKTVANFTLAFIAWERYKVLVNTMKPRGRLLSRRNVVRMLITFWFVGLILHVPLTVFRVFRQELYDDEFRVYHVTVSVIVYALPLMVITFCYAKILKGVFCDRTILGENTHGQEAKEKKRFIRILVIVTIVFFVCNLPVIVLKAVTMAHELIVETFKQVMLILSFLSSATNPFIYGLQSERYRKQVREVFCRNKANRQNI